MSMGYIAKARLNEQDATGAIYEYWCLTQARPDHEFFRDNYDGRIMIIFPDGGVFSREDCLIKNASGTWSTDGDGKDNLAGFLIDKIREAYQETGVFPETECFHA